MYLRILLVLVIVPISAHAGSVWQAQSNEPCAGQVIVGDSGDDNDSYIIPPSTDNSNQEDYEYEYEVEEPTFEEGPVPDHMEGK